MLRFVPQAHVLSFSIVYAMNYYATSHTQAKEKLRRHC